jgi:transcriptional regulator with XRE-family HTH domain
MLSGLCHRLAWADPSCLKGLTRARLASRLIFAICKILKGGPMRLADKLRHLRAVEGQLRGIGRPLTKVELVRLMNEELGEALSMPYLSQIETGARPHLTERSRELLARFFRVHPGYLVGDPEGFEEQLGSLVEPSPDDVGEWLALRAEEQRADPDLYEALLRVASSPDPRAVLILLGERLADERVPPSARLGHG